MKTPSHSTWSRWRRRAAFLLLSALALIVTEGSRSTQAQQESAIATAEAGNAIEPSDRNSWEPGNDRSLQATDLRRQALSAVEPDPLHRGKARPRAARISLSLRDADLQEVLRSFARIADVNLVLDPGVEGKVNLELHDVPWDQALVVILKSHRLSAQLDGRIWRVD